MNDDIEVYLDSATTGGSYLESLIRCQELVIHRIISNKIDWSDWVLNRDDELLTKLHELIMDELDLALLGTSKAKSEILKTTKDNVKPINPGAA